MPYKTLNHSDFLKRSETNQLTIKELVEILEGHKGLFVIDDIKYDDVLYCGTDNLYFSYCFNCTTSKAIAETLLIVESITKVSEQSYLVKAEKSEALVFLKE